jgi:hypothetical protein
MQVLEQTAGRAAFVCVELLRSAASRTDLEGGRTAANLLRNLSMPVSSRLRIGGLDGTFVALLKHVSHRDPNTATMIGATLRLLVEGCPPNALLAAQAHSSDTESPLAAILNLDVAHVHPFCRAELARFVCLTIGAACGAHEHAAPEPLQSQLAAAAPLQFGLFLLASRQPMLHAEAISALLAARAVYHRRTVSGGHGEARWPIATLTVPAPSGGQRLAEALEELRRAGSLSAEQCATLLAED